MRNLLHDDKKDTTNPVKSRNFDPFQYGYLIELPSSNSMLMNKILDYAIYKAYQTKTGWCCEFTLKEICEFDGTSYSSFNKALRNKMEPRIYQIHGEDIPLFHEKDYKYHSGVLSIQFHERIEEYMEELKEFISYDIDTLFLFKHKPTQLLYKLLYAVGNKKPVRFTVDELKSYLFSGNTSVYPKWAEFNRNVLSVAKKDVDQLTDYPLMHFDYKPVLAGKGGKVDSIDFYVFYPDDEVINIHYEANSQIGTDTVLQELLPEIKISKDSAKELSKIVIDKEQLSVAKELYLSVEYVRDAGKWLYFCIFDHWDKHIYASKKEREVVGDGMVTYTRSIYEVYRVMTDCVKQNNFDKILTIIGRDQIAFQISNNAHCFLIKEMVDLLIRYYLGFKTKPSVTTVFAEKMGYNLYRMVDKIKLLKMCNKDYAKKYFKTFEKIELESK